MTRQAAQVCWPVRWDGSHQPTHGIGWDGEEGWGGGRRGGELNHNISFTAVATSPASVQKTGLRFCAASFAFSGSPFRIFQEEKVLEMILEHCRQCLPIVTCHAVRMNLTTSPLYSLGFVGGGGGGGGGRFKLCWNLFTNLESMLLVWYFLKKKKKKKKSSALETCPWTGCKPRC